MKRIIKTRWYVWIFCFYLASTIHWMLKGDSSVSTSHLDLSFFTFFDLIFMRLYCIWMVLWLTRATTNWVERVFLVLNAIVFALSVALTLHRLGYFSPDISPQISSWIFFVATVLLGYRTDEVVKQQDKRIETITCSTPL